MSEKLGLMWKVINLWRVKKTLLYIFLVTLTYANFEVYIAYVNELNFEITPTFEGTMLTLSFFGTAFWLVMYNSVLINAKTKRLTLFAILARYLSSLTYAASCKIS